MPILSRPPHGLRKGSRVRPECLARRSGAIRRHQPAISVWSAAWAIVVRVKPQPDRYQDGQADLDRLVDARLRAEHDGDIEAILAPLAEAIVHDVVGSIDNPIQGCEAVRRRYAEHVSGLGDDAFWVAAAGILFVRKGDHAIELLEPAFSLGAGGSASRDAMVTLAHLALPKL
jgi:hypothetical protein